jgi:hypothetical protein
MTQVVLPPQGKKYRLAIARARRRSDPIGERPESVVTFALVVLKKRIQILSPNLFKKNEKN